MTKTRAFILMVVCMVAACASKFTRPAAYGTDLEECNRLAETLQDSICCENLVRMRYPVRHEDGSVTPRPLRDASCYEGGDR